MGRGVGRPDGRPQSPVSFHANFESPVPALEGCLPSGMEVGCRGGGGDYLFTGGTYSQNMVLFVMDRVEYPLEHSWP